MTGVKKIWDPLDILKNVFCIEKINNHSNIFIKTIQWLIFVKFSFLQELRNG